MAEFEVIFSEKANGFVKKTQKTPAEEIKRAKEYRSDFKERMGQV